MTDCQAQSQSRSASGHSPALAQYGFSSCAGRVTYSVRHQPVHCRSTEACLFLTFLGPGPHAHSMDRWLNCAVRMPLSMQYNNGMHTILSSTGLFISSGMTKWTQSRHCCSTKKKHRAEVTTSLIDWISDTRSQGYTDLQSLVKCLDHRGFVLVLDTVCS